MQPACHQSRLSRPAKLRLIDNEVGARRLPTESEPVTAEYRRAGYIFTIEVRVREYPWAAFRYWAKAIAAARVDAPSTPIALTELPFTRVQHPAASPEEAIEQVKRQIDDSLP